MTQLCELIDEYGDEVEADFMQFYNGLDLADVFRGTLTRRRVFVLTEQLAFVPDSRYRAAALGGTEFIGFDRVAGLLADIHDAINNNTVVTAKSAGAKNVKSPDAYPRPVVKKTDPNTIAVPTIDDFPIHLVVGLTTGK